MSGIENLKTRLQYDGGNAEGRLIKDKLDTLKKALLYSYQAETAILKDGREFRCLINPNKETGDYDNKIISIPFEDVCLNSDRKGKMSDGIEKIGLQCGDVFTWKETNTHWLVFLEYLEEVANAYFRAQIRKCDQEIDINGQKYWIYLRGPVETSIPWNQKAGVEWNDMNYSLLMYVTKDDNTLDFLHRFTKLKIAEPYTGKLKTWQVVRVNPYYGDGIIQVALDEFFENSIQDAVNAEKEAQKQQSQDNENCDCECDEYYEIWKWEHEGEECEQTNPLIEGPREVLAFSTVTYSIANVSDGQWYIKLKDLVVPQGNSNPITFDVNMKKGSFILSYKIKDEEVASLEVKVNPY